MNIDCLPNLIENLKDYTPTVCSVAIPVDIFVSSTRFQMKSQITCWDKRVAN